MRIRRGGGGGDWTNGDGGKGIKGKMIDLNKKLNQWHPCRSLERLKEALLRRF